MGNYKLGCLNLFIVKKFFLTVIFTSVVHFVIYNVHVIITLYKEEFEMNYFQARISAETAFYFRELKTIYEKEDNISYTQAQVIVKALDDISSIQDWDKVILANYNLPKIKLDEKDLRIRIQINPDIEEMIKNYKSFFPQFVGTRSVTLGVTLKYILKGAIFNFKNPNLDENISIDTLFEKYELRIQKLVAEVNLDDLHNVLLQFKREIKKC